MRTPRPYAQTILEDGRIIREFDSHVPTEELIWHQDRKDRQIRVIESGGWSLQLEEGLPFPLIEGRTYHVPMRSWHRTLRGEGRLVLEIIEGNDIVSHI